MIFMFFFHLFAINKSSLSIFESQENKKGKKNTAGISEGLEHRKLLDISFSAITMHISTFMTWHSEVNVRQAELIKFGLIE